MVFGQAAVVGAIDDHIALDARTCIDGLESRGDVASGIATLAR